VSDRGADFPKHRVRMIGWTPGYSPEQEPPPASGTWFSVAEGYFGASERLLGLMMQGGKKHVVDPSDVPQVRPAIFLCRHAVEVALKLILVEADNACEECLRKEYGHDLRKLWTKKCLPVIRQVAEGDSGLKRGATNIGDFVGELSDVDPKSLAGRYPGTDLGTIDLRQLWENVFYTHFYLMGIASRAIGDREMREEMEALIKEAMTRVAEDDDPEKRN